MPDFGLPDKTLAAIRQILAGCPTVEKAILYGSRAKGDYRSGSDIDLTLIGEGLDLHLLGEIAARLEESSIPYQVDLSLWSQIDHVKLREHIERVGVVFYQRSGVAEEGLESRIPVIKQKK
ncbi:MAG: nucleotidyltransferase domain-containing protein [Deltaproteobacteria bacterium]|nr:nucleotidyltransferase domain-containing protein [Deltaproteobacteria bacterium]